jgi:cytochrome c-type biogenesis protein CcmH
MNDIARDARGRGREPALWAGSRVGAASAVIAAALLALALAALAPGAAAAKEAPEVGDDPAAERHMMVLAGELRCLQCQNQTLADSNAPLAVDLRQQIRELIAKGQTDEQIKAYLGARYGDFVFYRPPVQGNTLLLWFGPGLVLVAGLAALYITLKRRLAQPEPDRDLSEAEARRAQHLLEDDAEEGSLS